MAIDVGASEERGDRDEPPPYTPGVWSNARPIGSEAVEEADVGIPSYDSVAGASSLADGLRRITILRGQTGFGFTIFGSAPVTVIEVEEHGPAYLAGLRCGDRVLEVNDVDATSLGVDAVGAIVQRAERLRLIVVADVNPTPQPSALHPPQNIIAQFHNSTGPPSLAAAGATFFCCPLIGCAALWYAAQAHEAQRQHDEWRTQVLSRMARKLMSCAVLYGVLAVLLYLFARLGHGDLGG